MDLTVKQINKFFVIALIIAFALGFTTKINFKITDSPGLFQKSLNTIQSKIKMNMFNLDPVINQYRNKH